jgi:hypothetical protein
LAVEDIDRDMILAFLDELARLRLRPTRRVVLWLRSPVHDELW